MYTAMPVECTVVNHNTSWNEKEYIKHVYIYLKKNIYIYIYIYYIPNIL